MEREGERKNKREGERERQRGKGREKKREGVLTTSSGFKNKFSRSINTDILS